MSHWKKIVLSPYFAATTGATALALTLGVANAQNAPLPVVPSIPPTTSTVPAPTDAAVLPAPTPANPVPLGTGLPNAASQTLGASLAPNVPAPTANVEALRAQAQALEARLRQLPTNA
ncbi:MAG: hypothetical protein IKU86_10130, partial [Thermoguttaceae bacterium]|nr:hypothetical protein [Thermoguttaceae bacterium]